MEKLKPKRRKRCERCGNLRDAETVFIVRDKHCCEPCGKLEIKEWNAFVHEAEKEAVRA